jgi:hypothetical protein
LKLRSVWLRPTFPSRAKSDLRAPFRPKTLPGSPMIVISSRIARISTPNLASGPLRAESIVATKAGPVRALPCPPPAEFKQKKFQPLGSLMSA